MFSLAARTRRANRTTLRRPGRRGVESLEARQVLSVSIGGAVWLDANSDGVRDASETGSAGGFNVFVYPATSPEGAPWGVAGVVNGRYTVANLPAGDYVVTLGTELLYENSAYRYSPVNRTSDETMDSDVSPTTGYSSVVTLSDGQSAPSVDVGVWNPGRIEGSATFVGTINGVGETIPLGGIKFSLYGASGVKYADYTTSETGRYTFAEVPEGDYYLRVEPLGDATIAVSTGNVLFDTNTLRTPTFRLTGGTTTESDVRLTTTAPFSIGGRIWHDLNANGAQDAGEPGIAGRQVGIVSDAQGGSYYYGPRAMTDADGNYRFDGLPPARYQLGLTTFSYSPYTVNNEAFSAPRQSDVDVGIDSDFQPTSGVTPTFVVEAGANLLDFDGGLFYRGTVSGTVFDDANGDGTRGGGEQAMPAADVRLLREDGSLVTTTRTRPDGAYAFAELLPRSYIVEIVRPDGTVVTSGANAANGRTAVFPLASNTAALRDFGIRGTSATTAVNGSAWNDANGNGIRDAGEQPLAEVSVELLHPDGAFVGAATTNAAGNYTFSGISPGGYLLRFTPASGTLSPMNQGGDLTDSDVNRGSGLTAPFPIFAGQTDTSQDVGVYLGPLSTDAKANLRVTEVGFVGHSNSEFVEVRNIGTQPIDLTGVQFTKGIAYNFSTGLRSLFPGEYGVIVGNYELLSGRTDVTQINVLGLYSGDINRQERLTLVDATGQTVLSFSYDDDWFVLMDRETMPWTLSVIDETIAPELWEQRSTWRPSSNLAGSPGRPDPATTPNPGAILINEVLTKSNDGFNDLIELHNTTGADIDVGGWYLGDSNTEVSPLIYLTRFRIPGGTVVPANGFLVLSRENDFGVFGLSSFGETLHLVAGDEYGAMAGYAESISFGATEVGVSFGRYENAAGVVDMLPQQSTTFGAANGAPRIGPVVISEIMYNSAAGAEFIELVNTSNSPIDLGNPGFEYSIIVGGIKFVFAQGTVLPAGGRAVVTNASPTDFRLQHGLGLDVIVAGPLSGDLPNSGAEVELWRSDPDIKRENGKIDRKQFFVDRVTYDDTAPWPVEADGAGASLERISFNAYGNQISNWMPSQTPGGTPGRANTTPLPGDCDGDGTITPADIDTLTFAVSTGTYDAHFDVDGSGTLDTADRSYLIGTLIGASFGDANLDGSTGLGDVLTVRQHLGSPGGWGQGDFTGDGLVNLADLAALIKNFGSGALAAAAPSALVVAATGDSGSPRQPLVAATRNDTRRNDAAHAEIAPTPQQATVDAIRSDRSSLRRVARPVVGNAVDSAIGRAAGEGAESLRAARVARSLRR